MLWPRAVVPRMGARVITLGSRGRGSGRHPCTGQGPAGEAGPGGSFQLLRACSPSLSHRELEVGHGGSIYAMEACRDCRAGLLLFGEPVF